MARSNAKLFCCSQFLPTSSETADHSSWCLREMFHRQSPVSRYACNCHKRAEYDRWLQHCIQKVMNCLCCDLTGLWISWLLQHGHGVLQPFCSLSCVLQCRMTTAQVGAIYPWGPLCLTEQKAGCFLYKKEDCKMSSWDGLARNWFHIDEWTESQK